MGGGTHQGDQQAPRGVFGWDNVRGGLPDTPQRCYLWEGHLVSHGCGRHLRCNRQNSRRVPFGDTIVAPRRQIFVPDVDARVVIQSAHTISSKFFSHFLSSYATAFSTGVCPRSIRALAC